MAADQRERLSRCFASQEPRFLRLVKRHDQARMQEVFAILRVVKTPSARNIGLDGAQAVWLIAQHNCQYEDAGRIVLGKMRRLYYRDKAQVYYQGIPYLVDRLMVAAHLADPVTHPVPRQRYGTQGYCRRLANGHQRFMWYPVTSRKKLAERRQRFGLNPNREPGRCLRRSTTNRRSSSPHAQSTGRPGSP